MGTVANLLLIRKKEQQFKLIKIIRGEGEQAKQLLL